MEAVLWLGSNTFPAGSHWAHFFTRPSLSSSAEQVLCPVEGWLWLVSEAGEMLRREDGLTNLTSVLSLL